MSTLSETALKTIAYAVRFIADAAVTVKRTEAFLLGNTGDESSRAWEFGEEHLEQHEGNGQDTAIVCLLKYF